MDAQNSRDDMVVMLLEQAGYPRLKPPTLQPADIFLELSGEDIRRRLFLTQDDHGRELCLRPEFTIPACRLYLEGPEAGQPKNISYLGPVFRHRPNESGEFTQAGVESLGRKDAAAADAEILDIALQAARALAGRHGDDARIDIAIGDVGLTNAFLQALALPAPLIRRLRKALAAGLDGSAVLDAAAKPASSVSDYGGVLKALEGVAPGEARAFVEDMLSIAGITSVGGRSIGEIAERFLDKTGNTSLPDEKRRLIGEFLALAGDPDSVSAKGRKLARAAGLELDAAFDLFDARTGFMAARGIEIGEIRAATGFARNIDYYSGFVFELTDPAKEKPLAGGGRYDTLLTRLGAKAPIPAVGFAIWLDRFGERA